MAEAPKKRNPIGRLIGGLLLVALLCGFLGLAGASLLAISEVLGDVGPPSTALGTTERATLAAYLLAQAPALNSPAGDPSAKLDLLVESGESAQSVIDQLVDAHVLDNGTLLRNYMRYRGLDVGIQAGSYEVTGAMTVRELASTLQTARPPEIVLTIVEGWRLEQIAEVIDRSDLGYSGSDFLVAARAAEVDHELFSGTGSLEGFLFPDTYRLEPDSSPQALVEAALDNFLRRVDPVLRQSFELQGLTLIQAVTLASIIEREAIVPEERPMIAAVFYKRLRGGLLLEADPTVQYALGWQPEGDWWKSPLTLLDLEVDSPYNTYRTGGLPPAPIAAPGLASLEAVGSPIDTSFLYFRATCDGSGRHQFAETFDQHLLNACP
ncbi:MAG: endolytic transglycosylase MltG [Chloroflexi bacterium]|nr:endolytic transglycosylase MltG [Chloroflexota bacterium]